MKNKLIYIANWKMNFTSKEVQNYLETFLPSIKAIPEETEIVFIPPFTLLPLLSEMLKGSKLKWGAQNMFYEKKGAFTGEISSTMIKDYGGSYVILGHSERRKYFKESNSLVAKKLLAALEANLIPIVCVGENLKEREAGETFIILKKQLLSLSKVWKNSTPENSIIIAYEPVWAIGTGVNATPLQAQEAHKFIKSYLYSNGISESMTIAVLYGGSVNSNNVSSLIKQPDVSGCLVGGSSLDPEEFKKIVFTRKEVRSIGSR